MADRTRQWLCYGVSLVWNVEPIRRQATVHSPSMPPVVLGPEDFLDGGELVPGLRIKVAELFED